MSLFQIEKRFGNFAVKKGFITEEQLAEAMVIQIEEDLSGLEHRLVGQILMSQGYLSELQIFQVLSAMRFPLAFFSKFFEMPPTRASGRPSG